MMWGNWGYGPGFLGMGLVMLLVWIVLIAGVVALIRWLINSGGDRRARPPEPPSALEILAQRYARGEIDREEYEQKRRDLGG